jgi:hypothetical protein
MNQPNKPKRGCLFWGGIVASIMLLLICFGMFLGYKYAKHLIDEYTDATPMTLPTVNLSSDEIDRLRNRIAEFSRAVDEHRTAGPLVLTTDEVNALIMTSKEAEQIRGHVYVGLDGDQVKAQVSIPGEKFGFRPLRGRYLNGTGTLKVAFVDSELHVDVDALTVKGKPLPDSFMQHIRVVNFAEQFNQDPNFKTAMDKLQDIQIKDSKLIITPKKKQ